MSSVYALPCSCEVFRPDAGQYREGSIWICDSCYQQWTVVTRRSGGGLGAAVPIGGMYVGGMRNGQSHVWKKLGKNVGREVAIARARADAEAAYEHDAQVVRALRWDGLTVRKLRAMETDGWCLTWGFFFGQPKRIIYRRPTTLERLLAAERGEKVRKWFPKSHQVTVRV